MKITINSHYQFERLFREANRENQFSREGLNALFDYLEELEQDCGEEFDIDVIGICCDFCEYDNIEDFRSYYGAEYESMEDIEDRTIIIPISGTDGFIIQQF